MSEPMDMVRQSQKLAWLTISWHVITSFSNFMRYKVTCACVNQELDKDLHSRTIAALGEDVVRAIQSSSVSPFPSQSNLEV
jgi:hypothetical protein